MKELPKKTATANSAANSAFKMANSVNSSRIFEKNSQNSVNFNQNSRSASENSQNSPKCVNFNENSANFAAEKSQIHGENSQNSAQSPKKFTLFSNLKQFLGQKKISKKAYHKALDIAYAFRQEWLDDIKAQGEAILRQIDEQKLKAIVLCGRPYHIDPEINHGIDKLINSLGLVVLSEDSISHLREARDLQVLNQWSYHSRLYNAAQFVCERDNVELVQLVSFGCGIDSITTDEVRAILEHRGRFYTQLKIDEISNLGAVKIRIRSLLAAMDEKMAERNSLLSADEFELKFDLNDEKFTQKKERK